MKRAILIALLTLSGCATVPTGLAKPPQAPELPPSLAEHATRLPPLTDQSLKGLTAQAVEDDQRYNDLAVRHNALITLYECVREALNGGKGAAGCLVAKDDPGQ